MAPQDPAQHNRAWWNRTSDDYQAKHAAQLSKNPTAWGVWAVPEQELNVLGVVVGRDVLEFGCGGAQWSIALAKQGARCVGIDLSERQLGHARKALSAVGLRFPLVNTNAEHTPFADGSFDVVFCDHGAMTYARPERTVAEASRLLRPRGLFAFNMTSPLLELCWDSESDAVTTSLSRDYFGLRAL